ncbi:LOW QUALITY PROTEIN: UDP-glucosyltransferase 2 [Stomoxys calcitrans]|uniref:LOW QUALITY PROTEIN: UDP-glucosyltransferase 2 n=1 Tax=Stomoxys calcitrans TaxID=35570 RepID=UPI0027E3AD7A|nr:LOW QUALITY PROTEIN: UDP-glucosyltransferase 2 [Stomoxys calcitrans]
MRFLTIVPLSLILVTWPLGDSVQGSKILSVFPFPGKSQYIFILPLLHNLAEKGHEVTSISVFPQDKPMKNFRDIIINENAKIYEGYTEEAALGLNKSILEELLDFLSWASRRCQMSEHPKVKEIMKSETFDLVIMEIIGTEALLGLGQHFQAPTIAVSTFPAMHFIDYLVGNPSPSSYIPHISIPYGNHMSFRQRVANILAEIQDVLSHRYYVLPKQRNLYEKYFPSAELNFDEARRNVSLVLVNDHFTLRHPRPCVPNMIEVGGLHIKQQPNSLSQELQEFLDTATEGAIYFSLGSNVKSKDLPQETQQAILESFRDLKIKVLWKFEGENLPNKPANVLIRKWFDQQSVLAHPNVKMFISHGGFLSTTETIFHGKPVLAIPILGDQPMNAKNAVTAGFALSMELSEISKENFTKSIREVWTKPKYSEAAKRLSQRFRDKPMTPMDTALYWVEYVLRNKGAPYMRNAGQDLTFMEFHNLDVYIVISVIILTSFVIVIQVFCLLQRLVLRTFKQPKIKRN